MEIKAKIWDKTTNRLIIPAQLQMIEFGANKRVHYTSAEGYTVFTDKYIWLGFTGYKDRKGEEIYEGDIVKRIGGVEPKFEVIFDEKRAGFCYLNDGLKRFLFDYTDDEIEVIGNIYTDNPNKVQK